MTRVMTETDFVVDQLGKLLETGSEVSYELLDSVGDVVEDVEGFGRQFRYSETHGLAVPVLVKIAAMTAEEQIPLPVYVQEVAEAQQLGTLPADVAEQNRAAALAAGAAGESGGWRLESARPNEGRQFLLERAKGFLSTRFSVGAADRPAKGVMAPFRVITKASGLRVHYSAIYGLQPRVFGAWTTPVDGAIGAGTWMFEVDGPDQELRWDSGHFPVPPLTEATLIVA